MKTLFFISSCLLFCIQTSTASAADKCKAFSEEKRLAYVEETSRQFPLKKSLQAIAEPLLVPIGYGTPRIFRGLQIPHLIWRRQGDLGHGRPDAIARIRSAWGTISIATQSGDAQSVSIWIQSEAESEVLNEFRQTILMRLFPGISIYTPSVGVDAYSTAPTQLRLLRRNFPNTNAFGSTSRSLLNTLLNDPKNEFGLRLVTDRPTSQPVSEVPDECFEHPVLAAHIDLLDTFKKWTVHDGEMRAAKIPETSALLGSVIHLNFKNKTLAVSLETSTDKIDTVANIRRIVRAASESGLHDVIGRLPPTTIEGTAWISTEHLPIASATLEFLKRLDLYQNDMAFDRPLKGLSEKVRQDIRRWLTQPDGINQNYRLTERIQYSDVVSDI